MLFFTYCIPKSQFNSSQKPRLIGKCLNYADNWPIISIIVSLSESFFVFFYMIFVLVMSEWTPCAILPKIHLCVMFFSNVCYSRHLLFRSFRRYIMTFDFIVSKLEGESGTWLWTLLIVSIVIGRELTIASTYMSNVCSASSFKLLPCDFRSTFRMLLAVLICRSHTPPMWVAVGCFLIHVIQLASCLCRYCDIWLWSISWKALQSWYHYEISSGTCYLVSL